MTSILIADDQEMVRAGFRVILDSVDGFEVIAEADNGSDALELALQLRPDVCVLDIQMPGLNGIEVTRRVAGPAVAEPLNVVVVTTFDLDENVVGALEAGASGFVVKDAGAAVLVEAVRAAANGDALISPSVTRRLLASFATSASEPTFETAGLTEREQEVLQDVCAGLTNGEMSESLHISLSTVKSHVAQLMTKTNTRNRVSLVVWAYETGFTSG